MALREVKACGVLCLRQHPQTTERQFLLMRHSWRWDLPKGHINKGEDERTCALREFHEETGIHPHDIQLDATFRYETSRQIQPPYFKGETVEKTYVFFAGEVAWDVTVSTSDEHLGYVWHRWQPPHAVSAFLIDDVLSAYARHLGE